MQLGFDKMFYHTMFPKVLKTMSFMDNQKVQVPPQSLLKYQNIQTEEWKSTKKKVGVDPWHKTGTWTFISGI